jgi:hypothetical protein
MKSFNPRSLLKGLLVALLILSFGTSGVTFLWVLQPPRLFFYYVICRLPLLFGLVLAMLMARPIAVRAKARSTPA